MDLKNISEEIHREKSKNTHSELLYCVMYQFQFLVGMYYIPARNIRSTNI